MCAFVQGKCVLEDFHVQDNLMNWFSPSVIWVLGLELTSSGLEAAFPAEPPLGHLIVFLD